MNFFYCVAFQYIISRKGPKLRMKKGPNRRNAIELPPTCRAIPLIEINSAEYEDGQNNFEFLLHLY